MEDFSLTLGMTGLKVVIREEMAIRRTNRHLFPLLNKNGSYIILLQYCKDGTFLKSTGVSLPKFNTSIEELFKRERKLPSNIPDYEIINNHIAGELDKFNNLINVINLPLLITQPNQNWNLNDNGLKQFFHNIMGFSKTNLGFLTLSSHV